MNQFTKKPPRPSHRQWQPQPAPVLPLTPDPAQPAVTWYQNYAGQVYPGYGTPYDIVAANIDNINTVADNIDNINEIVSGEYLPVDGSIPMTGLLTLSGDPALPLNPVTLQYLQADYLPLAGGSMNGTLVLAGPPQNPNDAATKSYIDQYAGIGYTGVWQVAANHPNISGGGSINGQYYIAVTVNPNVPETVPPGIPGIAGNTVTNGDRIIWNATTSLWEQVASSANFAVYDARYLQLSGVSPMTGPLTLSGDPTAALQPVTLQYFNAHSFSQAQGDTRWLQLTGGTLTGPLTLAADPTANLQAATKEYVDNNAGAVAVSDTAPVSPRPGSLWWNSLSGQLFISYQDPNSQQFVIANTGGIPDAPSDGNTYARQNQSWTNISAVSAAAPNNTGRNLVHNGTFTVQQRGVGPWTSGTLTADRWTMGFNIDTFSWSIQMLADADRTAIGDESAQYTLQNVFTGSSTAGAYNQMAQHLENVRRFANRTITVSFWAKAVSGAPKLGVDLLQTFGTGGSPSAVVAPAGQAVTLSTTWARYSVTFSMPSVAGKTFGTTAGTDYAQLEFWYSDQGNFAARSGGIGVQSGTIQLWGVQLEVGSVATPLAKRDPADDLALCQRFYQSLNTIISFPFNPSTAGWTANWALPLLVSMRAAPSIVFSGTTYTNAQNLRLGATAAPSFIALAADAVSTSGGFGVNSTVAVSADL